MTGIYSEDDYRSGKTTFRIITMDGGGIYGLLSGLMLRQMCEQDESFMAQEPESCVHMFAGTSAGALSSLLMAQSGDPRQFVLGGGLEEFWKELGIFFNGNLTDWWLSWFGLKAWLGKDDFLEVLKKYFGDRTLGDLPTDPKIMILTYNWSGDSRVPADQRRWMVRYFTNYNDEDKDCKLVDVAYAAAAPPPFRAVINGLGDGALFANNPSVNAYSVAKNQWARVKPIAILSVGVGCRETFYWLRDFNLGLLNFNLIPTNPLMGSWMPPALQVLVDGPSESATISTKSMMGPFYFRLNPGVLGPPNLSPNTTTAMLLSRNPVMHHWLLKVVEQAAEDCRTHQAVSRALDFVQGPCWLLGEASDEAWLLDILGEVARQLRM